MRRIALSDMLCPIARSLDRVGAWWSILILRDAFHGLSRFDQFQKSLPIAPNMLSRRLSELVAAGLLEKQRYSDHPPRDEYRLTEAGRDFYPVLLMLMEWGNRHFAPEGASSVVVERETGQAARPVVVDTNTGRAIDTDGFAFAAGPGADESVRRRMAFAERKRVERLAEASRG